MPALNHPLSFAGTDFALPRYAVSLIDRRTGRPHRISDIPLRLITCEPFEAARDMMRDRDPSIWETAIHRLDIKGGLQ